MNPDHSGQGLRATGEEPELLYLRSGDGQRIIALIRTFVGGR